MRVQDRHITAVGGESCADAADLATELRVCLDRFGSDGAAAVRCRTVESEPDADEVAARVRTTCRDGVYRASVYVLKVDGSTGRGWSSTALVGCDGRGEDASSSWACFTFAFPPSGGARRIGHIDASLGCLPTKSTLGPLHIRACIQRLTDDGWRTVRCDMSRAGDGLPVTADTTVTCHAGSYRTTVQSRVTVGGKQHGARFVSPPTDHRCKG